MIFILVGAYMSRSVLILTTDRKIDRRTLQQANSLITNGWIVTILALPEDIISQRDAPYIVRIPVEKQNFPFKYFSIVSIYKKVRSYIPVNSRLMQILRQTVWTYLYDPETFYMNLFCNELKKHTANIIMAIDLPMLPVAANHAATCGAKLVYDSHELFGEQEFSNKERRLWKRIEKKYIKHCDAVITVNPSIASELKQRYSLNAAHVLYNAIDPIPKKLNHKHHLFHQVFHLPADTKILLFQGGVSKGRHLETLVKSIKFLKNELIVLIILGDGYFVNTLEQMVQAMEMNHRIYFHPAVPQEELLNYTQSVDAGIIPYQAICLNNYYCTPNKLFEFIAAGIPILGSNLPEIESIIHKYHIGLTGDMSHPKKLARLIDQFFQDENDLKQWKNNSLIAQKNISWRNEEKKLLEIFEGIQTDSI